MAKTLDHFNGLLNWTSLNAWIEDQNLPGSGPTMAVRQLTGGTQNCLFLIERANARFVLRRPPMHLRANSNQTMVREARMLASIAGSDVPHPRLLAACEDTEIIGACFYLMEEVEGFSPKGPLPGAYAVDPRWRQAMGPALITAAAALGTVDVDAAGVADMGNGTDWHSRQVSRWRAQLESYRGTPHYDGPALPHIDAVGRWLSDHLPQNGRIGIIHGDLQFPNVMFSQHAPQINAIIDWELTTLGDPMLDLGWILSSWWEEGDPPGKMPMVQPWRDFPSRTELVRLYGELSGRDMTDMPWFFALACFKLGCIVEGTHARSKAGKAPAETGQRLHKYAIWLLEKAHQITFTGLL